MKRLKRFISLTLVCCFLMQSVPANAMAEVVGTVLNNTLYSQSALEKRYLSPGMTANVILAATGLGDAIPLRKGQTPSQDMSALQIVDWLEAFHQNEMDVALTHAVTAARTVNLTEGYINAGENDQMDSLMVTRNNNTRILTQMKTEIAGYASTLRNAVYDIENYSEIAKSSPSGRERAVAYRKMDELYGIIREVKGIVIANYADWQMTVGAADTALEAVVDELEDFGSTTSAGYGIVNTGSYAAALRDGLRLDKQALLLGAGLGAKSSDFTVLVAHKDEVIFTVFDAETSMPIGSAEVDLWMVDRSVSRDKPIEGTEMRTLTTDTDANRGAARFKSTLFEFIDEFGDDRFEICYSISKSGYQFQSAQHVVVTGGSIVKVYMKKASSDDHGLYVERVTFSDQDCYTGSAEFFANPSNDFIVPASLVLNTSAGYSGKIALRVGYIAQGTAESTFRDYTFNAAHVKSVTKDGHTTLDFSDNWFQLLKSGCGDQFTVSLIMTPDSGSAFEIEVPVKVIIDIAKAEFPTAKRITVSSFFDKFLNLRIQTPKALHGSRVEIGFDNPFEKFMFNVMIDTGGFAMLSIGMSAVDEYFSKKANDDAKSRTTTKDFDKMMHPIKSLTTTYWNKKFYKDTGRLAAGDSNKVFGANVRVTLGGSFIGAWKKQATSGYILKLDIQLVVSIQAQAKWEWQFFAGPVPFVVRLIINGGFSVAPVFEITVLNGANPDDKALIRSFSDSFKHVHDLATGYTAFDFKLKFDLNVGVSLFGGLGISGICSFGFEGGFTLVFGATIIGGGDSGFKSGVDNFSVGGYVKVCLKLFLFSFGYVIISGNFYQYPEQKAIRAPGDSDTAEDITPIGESANSAVRIKAEDITRVGQVESTGADMKIVDINGYNYGFYLKNDGSSASVQYLRLDEGIKSLDTDASALPPLLGTEENGDPAGLTLYEYTVSSVDKQNLVMLVSMYYTKSVTEKATYTTYTNGQEQTMTQDIIRPDAQSMYMRITYYRTDSNGKLQELTGSNHSTLIHLDTAPTYYNCINSTMAEGADGYIHAAIDYVAPGTREVCIYDLAFKVADESINYKEGSKPVREEPDFKGDPDSMKYKDSWWVANEMDDTNWTNHGVVTAVELSYTDRAHLSAYALLNMQKEGLKELGFLGQVTALLGRTWETGWKGHSELLAVTTLENLTLPQGFKPVDSHIRTPYGIQGIEVYSPGTGTDTVITHYQIKDNVNSTDTETKLDNSLVGIMMASNGNFTYQGYKAYDVENVPQNAVFSTGLGFPALLYMESVDQGRKGEPAYYRLRVLAYDPNQNLMSKPYTAAILDTDAFPTDRSVSGLHIYREKQDSGYRMKVIALQNEKSGDTQTDHVRADVYNFPFSEVVSLDIQHFALMTPAVRPGDTVSLYFTLRNDGNTPIRGFRMVILDLNHKDPSGAYKVFSTIEHSFETTQDSFLRLYAPSADDHQLIADSNGRSAISEYRSIFDRRDSDWFTEVSDASGNTTLQAVSTRYILPDESASCEVNFTIPVSQVDDIDLRATLTELYTDTVGIQLTEDAPMTLSAMAAWSAETYPVESSTRAYRAGNALIPMTVRMTAENAPDAPVLFEPYTSDTSAKAGNALAISNAADGTLISVSYDSAFVTADEQDTSMLYSRFSNAVPMNLMDDSADNVDLSLHATQFTAPDGTEMVRIMIQNESLVRANDIIINVYADDSGNPTSVIRLADSSFDLDHQWTLSVDVPLDELTGGRIVDAVGLQVVSPQPESNMTDNEDTVLLFENLLLLKSPEDQTVLEGTDAGFSVRARGGKGTLHYQWQICLPGKSGWENIEDNDSPELILKNCLMAQNGTLIRCIVTDESGQRVISNAAILHVIPLEVPMTGDTAHPMLWLTIGLLSVACFLFILRRRNER